MDNRTADDAYLDVFPSWLASLGADARELALALDDLTLPEDVRRLVAGGLNYLFKSLDLIPDGVEDLGFLDDAFVLRIAARLSRQATALPEETEAGAALRRLAQDADKVEAFLGPVYPRLERYTSQLATGAARGRTTDELVLDATIRAAFQQDVTEWVNGYEAPSFTRDEKTLLKLRAFLDTKLPA